MKSCVLCYNLKGTKKEKQITMIFGFLGYRVRHVKKEEYLQPIGELAGVLEKKETAAYDGEGFEDEMLIMNPAAEEMLNKALFLMKKEKVQVALKAVVTPNNSGWTSLALYEEIRQEHEYMTQKEKER